MNLTGTTTGKNRTSASYALGSDPGLMALKGAMQQAAPIVNAAGVGIVVVASGGLGEEQLGVLALHQLTLPE